MPCLYCRSLFGLQHGFNFLVHAIDGSLNDLLRIVIPVVLIVISAASAALIIVICQTCTQSGFEIVKLRLHEGLCKNLFILREGHVCLCKHLPNGLQPLRRCCLNGHAILLAIGPCLVVVIIVVIVILILVLVSAAIHLLIIAIQQSAQTGGI